MSEGARLIAFQSVLDIRGDSFIGNVGTEIPFSVKRFFIIRAPHRPVKRGGYAHLRQSELLCCIAGKVTVNLEDRHSGKRTLFMRPSFSGLYLPPMTWVEVELFPRSEVLVFSDAPYDSSGIVRSIEDFNEAHQTA